MHSASQILKLCNYIIEYNNLEVHTAIVNVNLKTSQLYQIKWVPELNALVSNWKNISLSCPKYVAPTIAQLILKDICSHHEYPFYRVDFKSNGNHTNYFIFEMDDIIDDKYENFNTLVTDFLENGLNKTHIELAQQMGVWEGFQVILQYLFDIKVELNEKKETDTIRK